MHLPAQSALLRGRLSNFDAQNQLMAWTQEWEPTSDRAMRKTREREQEIMFTVEPNISTQIFTVDSLIKQTAVHGNADENLE